MIKLVFLYFFSNFIGATDVLISPAIFSYHFEDKEKLNNDNYGIGLQFDLKKNYHLIWVNLKIVTTEIQITLHHHIIFI